MTSARDLAALAPSAIFATQAEAQAGLAANRLLSPQTNRAAGFGRPQASIADVKASGTSGKQITPANTWIALDLNTELFDPFNLVAISSNTFTVTENLFCRGYITAYTLSGVMMRLVNSATNEQIALSNSGYGHPSFSGVPHLVFGADVVPGITYRVDMVCPGNTNSYAGLAVSTGAAERYLTLDFWRM